MFCDLLLHPITHSNINTLTFQEGFRILSMAAKLLCPQLQVIFSSWQTSSAPGEIFVFAPSKERQSKVITLLPKDDSPLWSFFMGVFLKIRGNAWKFIKTPNLVSN
jgi:hypothetical protein